MSITAKVAVVTIALAVAAFVTIGELAAALAVASAFFCGYSIGVHVEDGAL